MQLKTSHCLPERSGRCSSRFCRLASVWNGRPPQSHRDCFHALLYVLVAGIPWEMLPAGFPSHKTV